MKLFGYTQPSDCGIDAVRLSECIVELSPEELKQLAGFFAYCSVEMLRMGDAYDHIHFRDWLKVHDESVPELIEVRERA